VCCSVMQCGAVCIFRVNSRETTHENAANTCACCSMLQCVAVCCSVVQCGEVCCSVLQCVLSESIAATPLIKHVMITCVCTVLGEGERERDRETEQRDERKRGGL